MQCCWEFLFISSNCITFICLTTGWADFQFAQTSYIDLFFNSVFSEVFLYKNYVLCKLRQKMTQVLHNLMATQSNHFFKRIKDWSMVCLKIPVAETKVFVAWDKIRPWLQKRTCLLSTAALVWVEQR